MTPLTIYTENEMTSLLKDKVVAFFDPIKIDTEKCIKECEMCNDPIVVLEDDEPLKKLQEIADQQFSLFPLEPKRDVLLEFDERFAGKTVEIFESPFDDKGHLYHVCGDDDCYTTVDENTFWCSYCGRQVNESNGMMKQYRFNECDDQICLKCYEEDVIENGQPREDFEGVNVKGMFAPAVEKNGYSPVEEFQNYFINDEQSIKTYNKKALDLIDRGCKIVTDYERLSICGGEGYISMWAKGNDPVNIVLPLP
jgi:hypothetical protein